MQTKKEHKRTAIRKFSHAPLFIFEIEPEPWIKLSVSIPNKSSYRNGSFCCLYRSRLYFLIAFKSFAYSITFTIPSSFNVSSTSRNLTNRSPKCRIIIFRKCFHHPFFLTRKMQVLLRRTNTITMIKEG